ncbi:hypothetical protein PFISCL1PPCAC_26264, partial [Pristionchus fissidentatus]
SASFYSVSSASSGSPVDQAHHPHHQQQYQPRPSGALPQIDSLMTTDAEPMFFDRMNDMKFAEVKMEPGLLHPPTIDLFQHHPELISYHGMTVRSYYNPLEYLGQQSHHLVFDPTPATAPPLAHLNYEQTYAIPPSPSCATTAASVASAFSLPAVHQVPYPFPTTTSYSPPPQDPLVPSSMHASSSSRPQKKRIQAVSCHSNSICANCGTRDTSLWRRNNTGEIECNACNLYFRKNGRKRPMSLKKGVIMKRNRKPRTGSESN